MSVVSEAATTVETVVALAATAAGLNPIARQNGLRNRFFWIGIGVGVGLGLVVGTALTASLGDATVAIARKMLQRVMYGNQDQVNREFLV